MINNNVIEMPLDLRSQSLLGYLPATVIKKIIEDNRNISKNLPYHYSIKTVSLFADISGFTKLSESFSKFGRIGPEFLAFSLNRYMEELIKIIGKNGGDIFKFAGDALLVIWPEGKDLSDSCQRAVQCALEIQSKLHNVEISPDKKLSIKIGIGVGDIKILFVGGQFDRSEYLIVGEAMRVACLSETLAVGGETICHESIHELISSFYISEVVATETTHEYDISGMCFYKILKQKYQIPARADAYLIRSKFNAYKVRIKLPLLKSFVPKTISIYLELEKERWSKEIRALTVMFLNLKIDLSHTKSEEGLIRIQNIVKDVQRCIYLTKGSLNKFLMDDKGSVMLVVWGLPFLSDVDDSSRAVFSALEIKKELEKHNCGSYIGITTGSCFTGVCGTLGGRREYSLLGEVVNLSARFMQQAISLGASNKSLNEILLCEVTKNLIQKEIICEWVLEKPCKGFADTFQFFRPISKIESKYNNISKDIFLPQLRTHKNNYVIEENIKTLKGYSHSDIFDKVMTIIGKKIEIESLKKDLLYALKYRNLEIFLIRGVFGSGKTLFIRKVMYEFITSNKDLYEQYNTISSTYNPEFVFISSQNSRTIISPFCGFKEIIKKMILFLRTIFPEKSVQ